MKDYTSKSLVLDIIYQMLDEEGAKGGLISAYETANRVRDLATASEAIDQINASIADIKDNLKKLDGTARTLLEGVLQDLPSAQPERKTGHWEMITKQSARCTSCRNIQHTNGIDETMKGYIFYAIYRYCPNCGAKMEVDNETD